MFTRKPGENQRHFKPGNTIAALRQSLTFSQRLKDCLFIFRLSKTPHFFRFSALHNVQRQIAALRIILLECFELWCILWPTFFTRS